MHEHDNTLVCSYCQDNSYWIFWVWIFVQKGFFGVCERCWDLLGCEKTRDFLGIVVFISSNQQKCKHSLLLVWDLFWFAKKSSVFFWVAKFWSWDFLGIKYEPVSPPPLSPPLPPVIEISEWGPPSVSRMFLRHNIIISPFSILPESVILDVDHNIIFNHWHICIQRRTLQRFGTDWSTN